MNEHRFVSQMEPRWLRLIELASKAEAGLHKLRPAEVAEFVHLYRATAGDLATARGQTSNPELIAFLNMTTSKAYAVLHQAPRRDFRSVLRGAILAGAASMRRQYRFVLVAAAIFAFGIIVGNGVLMARPDLEPFLIQGDSRELFDKWKSGEFDERTSDESLAMTGFYASNNPRVSMVAGTVAASTFGVGTGILLYQNGLLLGLLGHEMVEAGKLGHLLVSIWPHGASEITGIFVSGGAGLCMGWALICPGRRRRGDALREAGKDAFVLLCMSVVMMLVAAPFEGFVSFNPTVPDPIKLLAGAIVFGLWLLYWTRYGAEETQAVNS